MSNSKMPLEHRCVIINLKKSFILLHNRLILYLVHSAHDNSVLLLHWVFIAGLLHTACKGKGLIHDCK